jgi:hypothetical protein
MSNDFTVEVPITCDRTHKVERVKMTLTQAEEHKRLAIAKAGTAKEVATFLTGIPAKAVPDLVVMFRGKTVVLPTVVCKKNDNALIRLLHELTQSDVFPKPAVTPRKKSTKDDGKRASSGSSASAFPAAE